jgi:hypothetical protein
MSRQNKVNPGQYTQRGRLTPDDAAREMQKQRDGASPKRTEEPRAAKKDASTPPQSASDKLQAETKGSK